MKDQNITVIEISQAQVLFNHIKGISPVGADNINRMLQEGYCVFIIADDKGRYKDFEIYDKWEVSKGETGQLSHGSRQDYEELVKSLPTKPTPKQ